MNKAHVIPNVVKVMFSIWIYVGWFGCVYFGQLGWGAWTVIFPIVSWPIMQTCFHLGHVKFIRLFALLLLGILFDSVAVHFGWLKMSPPAEMGWLPIWMISLWFLFVSSLPLLQNLFQKKYILAALAGAIFGPLSYRAGKHFGTVEMNGFNVILIYALFWAIYISGAIFWLGRKETQNEN